MWSFKLAFDLPVRCYSNLQVPQVWMERNCSTVLIAMPAGWFEGALSKLCLTQSMAPVQLNTRSAALYPDSLNFAVRDFTKEKDHWDHAIISDLLCREVSCSVIKLVSWSWSLSPHRIIGSPICRACQRPLVWLPAFAGTLCKAFDHWTCSCCWES